jgi:hypothetical protein
VFESKIEGRVHRCQHAAGVKIYRTKVQHNADAAQLWAVASLWAWTEGREGLLLRQEAACTPTPAACSAIACSSCISSSCTSANTCF